MNKIESILLQLISDSLWGTKSLYSVDINWSAIIEEAKAQTVLGIIINLIPESEKPKLAELQLVSSFIRYMYAQDELLSLLNSHNIPAIVLKGSSAAIYYPDPSMRTFGDIDFQVPLDYYEQTKTLLEKNYYIREYPEIEDRHSDYKKDGILYELHHHYSHEDVDIEDYVVDGLNNPDIASISDHYFPMLPKLANGLVLLSHVRTHIRKGLGLRQVVDWMMYVDKVLDDIFWKEEFHQVAKDKGMETFAIILTATCKKYLGLRESITWCDEADEFLCYDLMENLLSSGNFGIKNGTGTKIENVMTEFRQYGLVHFLQTAGEYNWKAYKKHHWLKPFCWVYQIFRYLRQGLHAKRGRQLYDDIARSAVRYDLLKRLEIF